MGLWIRGVAIAGLGLLTGCTTIAENLGSTPSLVGDAQQAPLIDAAVKRVGQKAQIAGAQGPPASVSAASPRAYSGSPDGSSLRRVFDTGGVVDVPRAHAYMHRILNRLLPHWPYEIDRVGIFVVNQQVFDAQVTSAGDILITVGMLEELESEDELAAIIAHELSHLLLNHHERAEQVADNKRMMNAAASAAVTYLMFSNTDWQKTGKNSYSGTVNTASWLSQSLQAGGACLAATYLVDKLIDPGWNRTQEDEADLLGIDLMIKAGYNANAALHAMRRRIEFEGKTQQSLVERRRESGDYDKMISDAAQQQGVVGFFTGAARSITAGVIDTISDMDDYISQRHRMSSDRLQSMQLYLDRHYPLRERTEMSTREYATIVKGGTTAKAITHHRLASEANKALFSGDIDTAYELARKSIAPPTDKAVAPRLAMYSVLTAQGNEEAAFKQLLQVKDLDNAPPQFFHVLADGYARRGRMELAQQMKERAIAREKSIYDDEKSQSSTFLSSMLSAQSGADRFDVTGYCETLRSGVEGTASAISGRKS